MYSVIALSYILQSKYCGNFGVVRPLGQSGILQFSSHMKKVPNEIYNILVRFAARLEKVVLKYLPSHVIRFMALGKKAVNYPTMKGVGLDSSEEPKFYSSFACGLNLVISSHVDPVDFTYCAVFAFKLDYGPHDIDRPLVHFTFPGLGVKGMSVTMRHGQVVIFNARQVCVCLITCDYIMFAFNVINLDCLFYLVSFNLVKVIFG